MLYMIEIKTGSNHNQGYTPVRERTGEEKS